MLDDLGVPSYTTSIVLCESDDREPDMADARTLLTLLHLRDIGAAAGRTFSIVSEMLDERDRELAEVARADDFIVSARVLSLLLAQIAETPDWPTSSGTCSTPMARRSTCATWRTTWRRAARSASPRSRPRRRPAARWRSVPDPGAGRRQGDRLRRGPQPGPRLPHRVWRGDRAVVLAER